ncbi:D-alanyl-D-alanine carboxypeptidase [Streptomyces sp. NPDC086519]|uniref:serine hydrolase n=1 Tax=Streptomyces sp. NPDC086519 TaxID=3154863 RepID=UPI00343A09C2
MAGESPDRSKQRESSAEPTSGNAGAVPETRDPRLAVAADKETAGGVDTATRIFSVRDLKAADETDEPDGPDEPDNGDTELRDAAATWVRTGDDAEEATRAATEAATEAEEGPETPADAEDRQETPETPEKPPKPVTAPEATTGTEDTLVAPKAPAEPEGTAPEGESATTDEPEDAKPKATAEPEDAKPEDKPATTDEPQDAAPEDARPGSASKATAEPEDAKPADEPATTDEPQDAAPDDAKPKASTEPEDAKPGSESKAAEAQGAASEGESATADEPEDAKPGTPGEPEDAKPKTADTPQDAKSNPARAPQDAKPGGKPKWAVADRGAKSGSDGGGSGSGDDGGADADGEEEPKGPPAPDNDGRTGGAGGKSDGGEGEAEAAVDQPTTTLKAPRAPQVDQPTTTLKLGPKTPVADAERTSRFVALKSDIKQGPKPETASTTRTTVLPQVGPERTTQQPLPPKPPLDLLAELTNTPPPPETPVRTLFRRVKIWTPLVIVLLIVFAVVQTLRPLPQPTLDLTAKDTYTFDGGKVDIPWPADGQAALDVQGIGTFGSSGDQKPVPIASVAKVMTAYIILRDHPLKSGATGPKIKIDQAAQDQANAGQESTVDVTAGDSITQREALESILIASANNVARLLARWDAGSEKSFVAKMNATAKKLGMTGTTYTDPSGLTNSTVSTAVDQVKLAKAAMASEPAFREVAAMMSYDDYKGVNHGNWNQLVGHNDVVGIKTGTTTSALGNLVFAAKKTVGGQTRTIIGAVLRQPASAASDNSILTAALNGGDKLIRAAQGALVPATIYKKGDVVGYVDDGLGGRTPVVATEDVTAAGWAGLKVRLSFQADDVPHTAKASTKVGTLTVGDGSGSAVRVPVALQRDLTEPGFTSKLTRLG